MAGDKDFDIGWVEQVRLADAEKWQTAQAHSRHRADGR
jgi:hypothetical protein